MTLSASAASLLALASCSSRGESPGASRSGSLALDLSTFAPGRGYDQIGAKGLGMCTVDRATGGSPVVQQTPGAAGQEVTFDLSIVESSGQLQEQMDISVAAAMKALAGPADVASKTSFVDATAIRATSVYILAKTRVRNSPSTVAPLALDAPSAAMLAAGNAAGFRAKCGDGFVSAYATGGDYFGLIELRARSAEERQNVRAALGGSYISFTGAADFAAALRTVTTGYQLYVTSHEEIGGGAGDPCSTADCLLDRAKTLPTAVAGAAATVIDFSTLPYATLVLPPDAVSPIDTANARDVEVQIVDAANLAKDWAARYQSVLAAPDQYVPFDTQIIQSRIALLEANLGALRAAAAKCTADYRACAVPPLTAVVLELPAARPLDCNRRYAPRVDGSLIDFETGLDWSFKGDAEQMYCNGAYGCAAPSADELRQLFYGTPTCAGSAALARLPPGKYWTRDYEILGGDDVYYVATWFDTVTGGTGREDGATDYHCVCAR